MTESLTTRHYREKLLSDPYRPGYHFAIPDGNGTPGDPNGAFFADGRYHLMYLYANEETGGFHWGHISSLDLLHWRHHPDALTSIDGDHGCFSGGAFVDDDQTAYLSFWKYDSNDPSVDNGGIALACSKPPYDHWTRLTPIAIQGSIEHWGTVDLRKNDVLEHIACADPSNIWKQNGYYYMQTGNKPVLDTYGRDQNSEEKYMGDWTDLFRSKDLRNWEFVHRFYTNPHLGPDWPDATEDDMCPSFLPLPDRRSNGILTDKWLQLFISHNKGAQYYIGNLCGETFFPKEHGRFSWVDNTVFAPEALIDPKKRQIGWFWLIDNPENAFARFGWSGIFGLPREFWYDGGLRMAPILELDSLQYNEQIFSAGTINGRLSLPVKNGRSFRLKAQIEIENATRIGFIVREDPIANEYTEISIDTVQNLLIVDSTHSGAEGRLNREKAPFTLSSGEKLCIDIFVDQSVVEVFVNHRQAICRRIYPSNPSAAVNVFAFSDGADFGDVFSWEMMPTNTY
ncbi:MAG: glycoside hydrolase family 32 protein [Lachnospiraceae bacterium]|nr:glycoside hydrolase family 32 protein [Lachnospiraceae bacterium]